MSIKRVFNGATLLKSGAYSKIVVENLTGFPLQSTGTVAIIGEAVGGEPGVLDILSKEQIQSAKARYKSGPIADALELVANPSKDGRIVNGASKIVVFKTNTGTQAVKVLKNAAGTDQLSLVSKNWGADENNVNVAVSLGSIADREAVIEGSIAGPFTLSGGETLIIRANGTTYTYTGIATGSTTAAALVTALNVASSWSSSLKPVIASLVTGTQRIKLTLDTGVITTGAKDYGYLKVDATSTLDTIIGVSGEDRGQKGSRVFTFKKGLAIETSLELGGLDLMSVKYIGSGTDASMDVKISSGALILTTTCVGVGADDLSIVLKDADGNLKHSIQSLSDLIASNAAYQTVVLTGSPSTAADVLDYYDDLPIKDVAAKLRGDMDATIDYINDFSSMANASRIANVGKELALVPTPVFFTGATDGTSLNSNYLAGFEAFKEERINIVVPLISQDIGAATIDSINALCASHVIWGWSTVGKSEREAFVSKLTSKTGLKTAARSLATQYTQIVGQDVKVSNNVGDLVWKDPWAYACLCAGMRAGAEPGEPLTAKFINANDIRVRDGSWNPKADYNEMIDAGVWIAEAVDTGGFRNVTGNTTYGLDASFVWNRESVVQAAGLIAYDLRSNLELTFTGTKARTGTAEAIANFIKARMSTYLDSEIIVGDDLNEGLGYYAKTMRVTLTGNTAAISVSVTPVQGIDFLLPTIYLADIRQSA